MLEGRGGRGRGRVREREEGGLEGYHDRGINEGGVRGRDTQARGVQGECT